LAGRFKQPDPDEWIVGSKEEEKGPNK